MRKRRIRNKLSALCLLGFCSACIGETYLHQYQPVGEEGWNKADTLTFPLSPLSADTLFDTHVGLRITPNFPYSKLWLAVRYDLKNPDTIYTDTLCLELSDTLGVMKGRGVTRLQYEHPALPLRLKEQQSGQLRIFHLMKKEILPDVCEVGLRLDKPRI